jgi:hypothetical protein
MTVNCGGETACCVTDAPIPLFLLANLLDSEYGEIMGNNIKNHPS